MSDTTTAKEHTDTLLTFPCIFPLKVMGVNHHAFESHILEIVGKHVTSIAKVVAKPSKTGKYLAITITFTAESKLQLDDLYQEINKHPDVRMML